MTNPSNALKADRDYRLSWVERWRGQDTVFDEQYGALTEEQANLFGYERRW